MMRRYAVYILAATLSLCSCGLRGKEPTRGGDADTTSFELPLPQVPATLFDYVECADYIMGHFWDSMEADDTRRCRSREFMEQNLVNFMSLFPHGSDSGCTRGIARLLNIVSRDTAALWTINDIVEHYLADPNSPMRDETHYILYLEELLRRPSLPEDIRVRQDYMLAMAKKNRPGTVAADFTYMDRDGKRRTLHGTASGEQLLLIFYDPECEHCTEILKQVKECEAVGNMTVLAVYTEGNRRLWEETKASMPGGWTVGIDMDSIVDREIYSIPAMPVMYLLDGQKRVIMKDVALPQLESYQNNR